MIGKGKARVTLGRLSAIFDGTPKTATAMTDVPGLVVKVTYGGGTTAPTAVGAYVVDATIDDGNYTGSATGILVIQAPPPPASPTIKGKPRKITVGPKITLAGKVPAGAYLEYAIRKPVKFIKAKDGINWKFSLKLKLGKNVIYIRSADAKTGEVSQPKKIIVVRHRS